MLGNFRVNQAFESLTRLFSLTITICILFFAAGVAHFSLDWKPFQALQYLCVYASFMCDDCLLGLAELEHLKRADFYFVHPVDQFSINLFKVLEDRFSAMDNQQYR